LLFAIDIAEVRLIFDKIILLGSTVIITLGGIMLLGDGHLEYLLYLATGFIYSVVLFVSMNNRPSILRLIIVAVVLGVANWFVVYAAVALAILPDEIARHAGFVFPSLAGAISTLLCIKYIWQVCFNANQMMIVLFFVLVASVGTSVLHEQFGFGSVGGFVFIINSLVWWNAFSIGLVFSESKIINKAKQVRGF
jgi:hypothetical protein